MVTVVVALLETRPCVLRGEWDRWARTVPPKPRQRLLYVYASLSRLDFQGFFENAILVFLGIAEFSPLLD